jgi:hypothetical protein
VTGGSGSIDYLVHRATIPQASVGVLWTAGRDWIRVGGEADVFTSNGYVSGRGGPIAELGLVRSGSVQSFLRAGYFLGEDRSTIVGAGVDLEITARSGIRVFVQDAFRTSSPDSPFGGPSITFHEPSFQIGWMWR